MQIVSLDDLLEMQDPIFWKKYENYLDIDLRYF